MRFHTNKKKTILLVFFVFVLFVVGYVFYARKHRQTEEAWKTTLDTYLDSSREEWTERSRRQISYEEFVKEFKTRFNITPDTYFLAGTTTPEGEGMRYKNPEYDISVYVPSEWRVEEPQLFHLKGYYEQYKNSEYSFEEGFTSSQFRLHDTRYPAGGEQSMGEVLFFLGETAEDRIRYYSEDYEGGVFQGYPALLFSESVGVDGSFPPPYFLKSIYIPVQDVYIRVTGPTEEWMSEVESKILSSISFFDFE